MKLQIALDLTAIEETGDLDDDYDLDDVDEDNDGDDGDDNNDNELQQAQ